MTTKVELTEKVSGFTERDYYSKAILNTDTDALLKHKLQKHRHGKVQETSFELQRVKDEMVSLKSDMSEIKSLLKKIITRE
jgi:hypothetical protein